MEPTTVVFVHGFISSPDCWSHILPLLQSDPDIAAAGYGTLCFSYPTKLIELLPQRRIPAIRECGDALRDFIERNIPEGRIMLVGHSMGGLVIQAYLAGKIAKQQARDLERIRTAILFATPNRGATILSTVRDIFSWFKKNTQDSELRVLDKDVADVSETIVRCVLGAEELDASSCPIPFQVYWGMQDNVVPEVSARGPFVEAGPLDGDHSSILQPADANDGRYQALKDALLHPVGHPAIYELDLWEVNLAVTPNDPEKTLSLRGFDPPIDVTTDNIAVRQMRFVFAKQNRRIQPWEQMYRTKKGVVETLTPNDENEASRAAMSEYYETGKKFTYVFTPLRSATGSTFSIKLRIYNGFGAGQRDWHDHLRPNARCRVYRFILNLRDYGEAGYTISVPPRMFFFPQDVMDHELCNQRVGEKPLPLAHGDDPWIFTWQVENIRGGVVDLAWDVAQPKEAAAAAAR